MLLDVVGVLVLVHEDVAEVAGHGIRGAAVAEQVVHEPLQVGEVGAVGVEERPFVAAIRVADRREKRVGGSGESLGIDEFLRDLVEVTARSFDGRPAGLPFDEEEVVFQRPDDLVEVLEDEEQLRELVECIEAVAQLGPVTVLSEHAVAEAVDRGNRQLREVARVAHVARRGG